MSCVSALPLPLTSASPCLTCEQVYFLSIHLYTRTGCQNCSFGLSRICCHLRPRRTQSVYDDVGQIQSGVQTQNNGGTQPLCLCTLQGEQDSCPRGMPKAVRPCLRCSVILAVFRETRHSRLQDAPGQNFSSLPRMPTFELGLSPPRMHRHSRAVDPLIHLHKMHRDICTVILWALVHGAMSGRWFPTLWRHNSSPTKI